MKRLNSEWVAIDLLAQAEHDELARTFLVCDNEEKLAAIEAELLVKKRNKAASRSSRRV